MLKEAREASLRGSLVQCTQPPRAAFTSANQRISCARALREPMKPRDQCAHHAFSPLSRALSQFRPTWRSALPLLAVQMSSDEFSEAPGSAGARARSTLVAMEVLFRHTAKLGVRLRANGHGRSGARVVGFEPTPDGQPSIAERTGHVHVGDVLLAVNGVRVSHLPLREIVKVAARAHQPLKLVVGRRIRRQPRPRHATWRSSSGSIVRTQPELLWAPSDAPEKEVDRFLDLVRQRCPQCPEDEVRRPARRVQAAGGAYARSARARGQALSALRKANMEVDRALDSVRARAHASAPNCKPPHALNDVRTHAAGIAQLAAKLGVMEARRGSGICARHSAGGQEFRASAGTAAEQSAHRPTSVLTQPRRRRCTSLSEPCVMWWSFITASSSAGRSIRCVSTHA